MSFAPPMGKRRSTFSIVRQVNIDDAALKKIAEALGIPEAEHGRVESISGEICIGPAPTHTASTDSAQGGSSSGSSAGHHPHTGTAGSGR